MIIAGCILLSTCNLIYGKESKENLDILKKEVNDLIKDVQKDSKEKRQKNLGKLTVVV